MSERHWQAPDSDVVLSCRVRLARNYEDIPFSSAIGEEQAQEVVKRAEEAVKGGEQGKAFMLLRMADLSEDERVQLVERHLVSQDLLKDASRSAALISEGHTISIMVNEEDHLRIQGLLPGLQLAKAAELAFAADAWLEAGGPYAFDAQFGYLTSCPTNAGTGMRVSAMLHLPALSAAGQMGGMVQAIAKLGMTVRGIYGEGSDARGSLYQLSNQVSLGRTEEDMINGLATATLQVAGAERTIREKIHQQNVKVLEDRLLRSLGIVERAQLMNDREWMRRYSDLRLAASMKLIDAALDEIDALMVLLQPASLNILAGRQLASGERDAFRAEKLRAEMKRILT